MLKGAEGSTGSNPTEAPSIRCLPAPHGPSLMQVETTRIFCMKPKIENTSPLDTQALCWPYTCCCRPLSFQSISINHHPAAVPWRRGLWGVLVKRRWPSSWSLRRYVPWISDCRQVVTYLGHSVSCRDIVRVCIAVQRGGLLQASERPGDICSLDCCCLAQTHV